MRQNALRQSDPALLLQHGGQSHTKKKKPHEIIWLLVPGLRPPGQPLPKFRGCKKKNKKKENIASLITEATKLPTHSFPTRVIVVGRDQDSRISASLGDIIVIYPYPTPDKPAHLSQLWVIQRFIGLYYSLALGSTPPPPYSLPSAALANTSGQTHLHAIVIYSSYLFDNSPLYGNGQITALDLSELAAPQHSTTYACGSVGRGHPVKGIGEYHATPALGAYRD
ncbi:hypothetical protein CPB86DRAFT_801361 [Serendipita vermifera]|nr:hypothetical protein CPB86DRAFT_801361 [Serendipita vermifera]